MKLGVAIIAIQVVIWAALACSASNRQYALDLQGCILSARDAGDRDARMAAYTACADALDKDGGK